MTSARVPLMAAVALGARCAAASPSGRLGDYQPVSDVLEWAHIAFDVKGITNAAHHHDFAQAKAIYAFGRSSCVNASSPRTLKGFVSPSAANAQLRGGAYFDSFTDGAGPSAGLGPIPGSGRLDFQPGFWDDFISAALDGSGSFANKSATSRMVAVKKGILGVIAMYVSRLLERSIALASAGRTSDGDGAPHAWDEAWALYYGACGEQCLDHCVTEGWCRFSTWEASKKRDGDHALDRAHRRVDGTVMASVEVTNYFLEGQRASRTGTLDLTALIRARNNIYRIFALTAARATLRYSYAMNRGNGLKYHSLNELLHMQAYAYFMAAAGWIEQAAPGAARRVLALLDFRQETERVPISLHCDVKAVLVSAYAALGLDCAKVGQDWAIPESFHCDSLPACPPLSVMPGGLPGYLPGVGDGTGGSKLRCGELGRRLFVV